MAIATPATAGGTNADTRGDSRKADAPALPTVPFIRASQEHREHAGIDVSRAMTASDQELGNFDIPAYGYLRAIVLVVTATGGAGTTVTLAEDAPFNAIKNISLSEPNGATILQVSSGHSLYLINKYGGYRGFNDPRQSPAFSTAVGSSANFSFLLRIPVELSARDALGSLPNQNAAATFKLRVALAATAQVFGGTVSTPPTVRVRAYLEAWDQPESASAGATNQVTPPSVNTTQFWTEQVYSVNSGNTTTRLTRVGNYIRNLLLVNRRASGTRANGDTDFPDPMTMYIDTRPQDLVERNNYLHQIYERYGYTGTAEAAGARDLGVFPVDFCHEFDGVVGHENRDLWLPTLGSTRLEVQGTFANASTLTVLTNDVTIASNVFL